MSDDNKLFRVAGVSDGKGGYKVRFASDMTRVKVLMKTGNSDIELVELPREMTKAEAVSHLKTTSLMERDVYRTAIENADAKYNAVQTAKVSKPTKTVAKTVKSKKSAPSIADIRARARASSAPADMLGEAMAALVAESQKNPIPAE